MFISDNNPGPGQYVTHFELRKPKAKRDVLVWRCQEENFKKYLEASSNHTIPLFLNYNSVDKQKPENLEHQKGIWGKLKM